MNGDNKDLSCLCAKADGLNFLIFWIIWLRIFKSCLRVIYYRYNFGQKTEICNNISMFNPKIIQKPIELNNFRHNNTPLINLIFIYLWFISKNPVFLTLHKHIFGYTPYRYSSWRKVCLNMPILFGYIIDK